MGGAQGGGSKTGLQPWHIIIFVIAAVFILWRGWAYTGRAPEGLGREGGGRHGEEPRKARHQDLPDVRREVTERPAR